VGYFIKYFFFINSITEQHFYLFYFVRIVCAQVQAVWVNKSVECRIISKKVNKWVPLCCIGIDYRMVHFNGCVKFEFNDVF